MKITRKLGLLVAVPLVAVVAFAALAVTTSGSQARAAERLRSLVVAGSSAGELAQALRIERSDAVVALSGDSEESVAAYIEAGKATDVAYEAYGQMRGSLIALPAKTQNLLADIDTHFDNIGTLRNVVSSGKETATAAAFAYRIVIADLLSFRESVAQVGGAPADLADRLRGASALAQATEYVGLQQIAVLRALPGSQMTPAAHHEIIASRTGFTDALQDFTDSADAQWRRWFDEVQTSSASRAARLLESDVGRILPGEPIDIDGVEWNTLMSKRADAMQSVQQKVDADITVDVTALRDSQRLVTGMETVAVIMAVALAVALAVWLGRPVVRGLRRLRDAARQVATKDLPEAVARLDNHEVLGELTPEQFADGMKPPVEVTGRDELAEVGDAFNEVQREAVRVAAQQALLRLHIGAIFVNLARRGHLLAGRLTSALDEAERDELDPERLERLFALDHLVTLLGRSNDSLLVLGGTSPAKVRIADEPIADVLTAAQGQIELYKRIQVGPVDSGIAVRAAFVDDVVKILAELMDNATAYSEPQVQVSSHSFGDRTVIQITDQGIGIGAQELAAYNSRLATRPILDLEAVRTMGLTVVGYISARLGVTVELRDGEDGGTTAEVTLPAALLAKDTGARSPKEPARAVPRLFQETISPRRPRPTPHRLPADETPSPGRGASRMDDTVQIPVVHFDWQTAKKVGGGAAAKPPDNLFDIGWRAAQKAAEQAGPEPADGNLPKRVPGTQLVPGGDLVEAHKTEPPADFRDPAAVSATYAAYARGRSINRVSSLPSSDNPKAVQ